MKKLLLLPVLLFLLPAPYSRATTKIIGGEDTSFRDFPFIVSLGRIDGGGGTIIGKKWILTAAHVGEIKNIFVGASKLDSPEMVAYAVETEFIHPDATGNGEDGADIKLLKLKAPIDFDRTGAQIIRLADESFEERGFQKPGILARVLGWGYTGAGNPGEANNMLRSVVVPLKSHLEANLSRSYNGEIDETMLPAGFDEGGKDACTGDSGGPLVVPDEDAQKFVLVGVVSWGEQCALPYKYGIYTKVSHFASWIDKILNENSAN